MILDKGIITVFRASDVSSAGDKPAFAYAQIYQSWYGELSFETSPDRPTDNRKELRTDARVRVLQYRGIHQNDIAVLRAVSAWDSLTPADTVYKITRAFHGQDDDGPTPITDLSLMEVRP